MNYTILKYLRISAEDIDLDGFDKYESNSIGNQRAYLDDFIKKMPEFEGCKVIEECDDGRTGTNFDRPGVQRAIEMAKLGAVQCIIVKDLSRWGRNYLEVGDFLEQKFPALGVRFISINDMYDSATLNGATSGIDIAFRNLVYEMYSHDLSEKVKSARLAAAKSGKQCCSYPFYGYIKDPADQRKLIIDEKSAAVVRRCFDMAEQNMTQTEIAEILNKENAPTPQQRHVNSGAKRRWTNREIEFWYPSRVGIILREERYTGKQIFGKMRVVEIAQSKRKNAPKEDWVIIPGAIPAIITEEQFNRVREIVGGRIKHTSNRSPSRLLFSLKLKCGHCGLAMRAVHRQFDIKYQCPIHKLDTGYDCNADWVFEKDIAAAVLSALQQQIILATEARKKLEAKATKITPNIEKLQSEIVRYQRLIEKSKTDKMGLWEKYHAGTISAESFQRENEKADDLVLQYTVKIPELQDRIHELETATGQENVFVERFSRQIGIQELTREVVEEFIKEIKVYAVDRVEIIFNYADEYAKVAALLEGFKTKLGA